MKATLERVEGMTLKEAREWLRAQFEGGAECPVCRQHVKLWRRSIHSTMAKALIVMARCTTPGQFVKMAELLAQHKALISGKDWGGDIMKLKYWDFLAPMAVADRGDGSRRSGIWMITPAGRAFAAGQIDALKYQYVYNGEQVVRSNADQTRIWISDALGAPFDYSELVRGSMDGSSEAKRPI